MALVVMVVVVVVAASSISVVAVAVLVVLSENWASDFMYWKEKPFYQTCDEKCIESSVWLLVP